LCDDDYWHNEYKLQKQVEILENNIEIGLVHTNYRILDEQGRIKEKQVKNEKTDNLFLLLFRGKYFNLTSSSIFRKKLMDEYVNLDDYVKYEFPIQDWNTWLLIAKHTTFFHLPESTVTYRKTSDSVSRPASYQKLIEKCEKEKIMCKYLYDKFLGDLSFDERWWNSHVNNMLLSLAYRRRDFRKAQEFAKKAEYHKSLKVRCAKNKLLFYTLILVKKIKNLCNYLS